MWEGVYVPIYRERSIAVSARVAVAVDGGCDLGVGGDGVAAGEVDLEGQGDERVGEGEHEVGGDGGAPAPDDELVEFQRRVTLWLEVLRPALAEDPFLLTGCESLP